MDLNKLTRDGEYQWRIEKRGDMRVPGILFGDRALMEALDDKVFEQLSNVATLPGIVGAAYAMPDAHWGYGFPIGGVAAFDPDDDGIISAGGVGFDISCGVRTLVTNLTEDDLEGVIEDDIIAPSDVDDVYTTDDGILRVDTLLEEAPEDTDAAQRILVRIQDNPVLRGKLASDDGKALALFIPLESKEYAHEVGAELQTFIDELGGERIRLYGCTTSVKLLHLEPKLLEGRDSSTVRVPVTHAKVFGWYDNEYGSYTNMYGDLTVHVHRTMD